MLASHSTRYLLPALLLVISGLAWAAVRYTSRLPRTDASGQGVRYMWLRLSGNDWLGVALVVASAASLALLTWLLHLAVSKIVSDGWWALAAGVAALVWLAGAAVAAVIAVFGFLSYAAGTDTLVQGPHGVRRIVTQGASGDSVDVYRPVTSQMYVIEPGTGNSLKLDPQQGRCTISEDQSSRPLLHCGNTAVALD